MTTPAVPPLHEFTVIHYNDEDRLSPHMERLRDAGHFHGPRSGERWVFFHRAIIGMGYFVDIYDYIFWHYHDWLVEFYAAYNADKKRAVRLLRDTFSMTDGLIEKRELQPMFVEMAAYLHLNYQNTRKRQP